MLTVAGLVRKLKGQQARRKPEEGYTSRAHSADVVLLIPYQRTDPKKVDELELGPESAKMTGRCGVTSRA